MVRGTFTGMKPGTILGHEAVSIVEEVGPMVRNFEPGDRVVVLSTIGCGTCSYCREGYYAQCDRANPNGGHAGNAFFGGPAETGPFHGLQAEKARIPFANVGMIKLPEISDDQAILISDIFPTGWFGADNAEIRTGNTVAVFGCGPVGQFTIASAKQMDAGRIFAIDHHQDRLALARRQGAECINFDEEDPVKAIMDMTGGIGVDRAIDAVGVDAECAHSGPAAKQAKDRQDDFQEEVRKVAPKQNVKNGGLWKPGDGPSQVLQWAVEALAKAGTLSIIGVYPPTMTSFPIGKAMNKNLTIKMGNCNHRRYAPHIVELVRTGAVDPTEVLTQVLPIDNVLDAYRHFDQRDEGWTKVELRAS